MPPESDSGPTVPRPRSDPPDGRRPDRRFIICGDTQLAYRMADELTNRYRARVTVMLTDRRVAHGPLIARLADVHVQEVERLDAAAFRQANLTTADAVALVGRDDVANVYAGLQAQETCPGVRLVLRVFNSTLAQRLEQLYDNAQLLSDVEIAVPAFVAACLGTTPHTEFTLGTLTARVTTREDVTADDEVWCGLATADGPDGIDLLPDDIDTADLVLVASAGEPDDQPPASEQAPSRRFARGRRVVAPSPTMPSPAMAAFRSTLRSIGAVETGIPIEPGLELLDARKPSRIRQFGHAITRPARTVVNVAKTLPSRLLPGRVSRSVRIALATMFGILVLGITAYAVFDKTNNPWLSLYVMLLTAVGEANPDDKLPVAQQILQTIVTFTGVAMIPVVSAAIVQASVPAFGRDRVTERNHVVVVGLGNVGTRVLRALHEQGFPVVAIDHTEHPYGAQYVRERHIHFIVGDESRESTLRRANVAHAAALLVLTSEDVVNLEYALQGRQLQPNLRVVLRLFDGDFADRVNDVFNVTISASVSNLAASNFAAAMVGREVIGTIPVGRRVLLVADVPVLEGSGLAGRTLASIDETGRTRVIATADSDGQLTVSPATDRTLAVGERVVVVATRIGLSQIVAASAPILGPPPPPEPVGAGRR